MRVLRNNEDQHNVNNKPKKNSNSILITGLIASILFLDFWISLRIVKLIYQLNLNIINKIRKIIKLSKAKCRIKSLRT